MNLVLLVFFWPVALIQGTFCFLKNFGLFILRGCKFHLSAYTDTRDFQGLMKKVKTEDRDVNERNGYGQTALHGLFLKLNSLFVDFYETNIVIIDFLIREGADINVLDCRKWSPLAYAISGKYNKEAIYLINSKGILIDKRLYSNKTALHYAVIADNFEVAAALINKGADKYVSDNFGLTPFRYAKNPQMAHLQNAA